jgi:hypothetical protein
VSGSSGERPEPHWARGLQIVLIALVCVGILSSAWRMIGGGLAWMGGLLLGVGVVTAVLAIRRERGSGRRADSLGLDDSGELGSSAFDYLVWTAIGVPMILVVGLLVFVLTGAR